ncbi:MAG: fibronectin type III domain-containing protein [Verrucomicrobiales bacterium]|nr:fibronectin type III domain-containing protein [Verrucomicrobiales bacterium]
MNTPVASRPTARAHRHRPAPPGRIALLAALVLGAAPLAQAQETVIAYAVPAGTAGNQNFGGTLGMDFDVNNPIIVKRIGVFDDNSDGLFLTITAKLWDRSDPFNPIELISIDFSPDDPGELVGGSRFKPLTEPLRLEVGFQGTIHAEGYGAEERLRNVLSDPANIVWTTHDGNGSIAFVGGSRYGTTAQWYPGTVDQGPAARYAAGTFEYETTPPLAPGRPVVTLQPGNQQISVTWAAITQPAPAATYRVLRAAAAEGPFTQVAEVTETSYVNTGLVNGTVYFYVVRGVTAGGSAGPDSAVMSAAPYAPLPDSQAIAYLTPAGTAGVQNFGGAFGLDFDVYNAIVVQQLGVFDDDSDGLKLPLTARIYNRETWEVLAELYFLPEDPGVLIEGMRFKALTPPLRLEPGFQGVIEADGYGAEELVFNTGGRPDDVARVVTNDGNGSLLFVGTGRYSVDPLLFPNSPDGGPANRYGAGTFLYETTAPTRPGLPVLQVLLPAEDARASLSWNEVTKPLAAAQYRLFRATSADGPWTQVTETPALSYQDTGLANGTQVFYKVVAVGAGGQTSADSNLVTVTPNPRAAGIAYINPELKEGNQAFGGSLGMHFNVARSIQITRLGVYDEYGDGVLNLTLRASVWNRQTREKLAELEFTPESPGEPTGGSLFKTLPSPLVLSAGFQGTIVAYGYGAGERLFNTGNRPDDVALLATFDGGSLMFVGASAYSATPGDFPGVADGGPANRYAAGTFYFEPRTDEPPTITIGRSADKVRITWTGSGALEGAPAVTGPWTPVAGATSGIELAPVGAGQFFRVKQ